MYCPSRDTKAGCLVLSKLVMATETLNHDFYHTKYQMLPSKLNTGSNMSIPHRELWFTRITTTQCLLQSYHRPIDIWGKFWFCCVQTIDEGCPSFTNLHAHTWSYSGFPSQVVRLGLSFHSSYILHIELGADVGVGLEVEGITSQRDYINTAGMNAHCT